MCPFCLPLYLPVPEPAIHTEGSGVFMVGIHECETTVVLDTVQAHWPGRSGSPNLLLKVWARVFTRAVSDHLSPARACSSPLTVSCLPLCCPESGPAKSLLGTPSGPGPAGFAALLSLRPLASSTVHPPGAS